MGTSGSDSQEAEETTGNQPTQEDGQEANEEPIGDTQAIEGELDATALDELASEEKLDLNDPTQRAMAERLLYREMKFKAAAETSVEEEAFSEFEREVYGEEEPSQEQYQQDQREHPRQEQQRQQVQPQEVKMHGRWPVMQDVGQRWQQWSDAHQAEMEELGRIGEDIDKGRKPDFTNLSQIRDAQFRRYMIENLPYLHNIMVNTTKGLITESMGPILPQVNAMAAQRDQTQAKELALGDLERMSEYKGVRNLMKPGEGTITFKDPETGQTAEFDNTPMNRILIKNPEILRIQVPHKDPRVALRLTMTARYRAAMRIHRGASPSNTKSLLSTAVAITKKSEADRSRQRMNAGGVSNRGGNTTTPVVDTAPTEWARLFNPKK